MNGGVILVAEDSPLQSSIVVSQLGQLGWDSDVASDGAQALACWRRNPERYALLLTDIQMPRLNGLELARHVRADSSAGARLPIVACSGSLETIDPLACRRAGIDECLPKPLPLAQLRAVLSRWQSRVVRRAASIEAVAA
jgi:two-component system, sensor histidine kinase and response regulator